VTVEPLEIRIV